MFGKRPQDLKDADVHRVLEEAWQEDGELELKKELPVSKGNEPWAEGENKIKEESRNALVQEVIAFANAHGGWLLIGVEETDTKPACAHRIAPIRDCADLAERLKLQIRDCVEPKIPIIEVAGIAINDDGSGIVAIHVPSSRLAPHRHTVTKECYYRRADRSEKMTMRDIQDLTLQVERGLSAINKRFEDKTAEFQQELEERQKKAYASVFGIRITLVPTTPMHSEVIHDNEAAKPPMISLNGKVSERPFPLSIPHRTNVEWRPILRGSRAIDEDDLLVIQREIHSDGVIQYLFICTGKPSPETDHTLYMEWIIALFCNGLCAVEKFRSETGFPNTEYAMEVEIKSLHESLKVARYGGGNLAASYGYIDVGSVVFPRYSIGERLEFKRLVQIFERDFCNYIGRNPSNAIEVDFDSAFKTFGWQE